MDQSPTKDKLSDNDTRVQSQWNRRSLLRGFGGASLLGTAVVVGHPATVTAFADDEQNDAPSDTDAGERPAAAEELVVPEATRAELTDSDSSTAGRIVRLTDDDRSLWLDTGEGWVSLSGEVFNVRAFGATGDGRTDDWTAFQTAIEAMSSPLFDESTTPYGRTLLVPPGRYRLAQSLVLNRSIHLRGLGRFGDVILSFDNGLIGLIVEGADRLTGGPAGRAAEGAIIEGLRIEAGEGSGSGATDSRPTAAATGAHGVWFQTRATIRHCAIVGFRGDGIHIEATDAASESTTEGQSVPSTADGWAIETCLMDGNAGHGVFASASGGVGTLLETTGNGGWGIHDESQFGNTYLQSHADANDSGPFQTTGGGNRSSFLGCVSERGPVPSSFVRDTIIVGGRHGAGYEGGNAWTANGSRIYLLAQDPGPGDGGIDTAPTLEFRASQRQRQPHLLVNDAQGQQQAELDVVGRFALGPLSPGAVSGGADDAAEILLQLSDDQDGGRAGLRWLLVDAASDFTGWVANARAFRDVAGPDAPNAQTGFPQLRLTFQTPAADGAELDTLTLRNGTVGIGTNAPAAALDITSTTGGFLPPRLTPEQRDSIAAPPEGSVIYNLSSKRLNTFDGGAWREEGGLSRLTAEQRDQIEAPAEGSLIYNLTSKRLNFHDGSDWLEVAVTQTGG
jgi:hypothetical protein